ncbi:MAG: dephospho-CoA kinase [Bacteroidales bacterium]
MIKVGITGGIGSGKTFICKALQLLSIPIFFSDCETKAMYNDTPDIQSALIAIFGKDIFNESNRLNRRKLAQLVFNTPSLLEQLNMIAHPAIAKRFLNWVNQQTAPYVVQEAALIFETNSCCYLDKVIGVIAPERLRIERVIQRDHITEYEIKQRIMHQLSNDEIKCKSDFVIINDGKEVLLPQILQIHKALLNMSNRIVL